MSPINIDNPIKRLDMQPNSMEAFVIVDMLNEMRIREIIPTLS